MAKCWDFIDWFKAKVTLEALHGDKAVQKTAAKHKVHPNQVSTWKRQAINGMADVFTGAACIMTLTEAGVRISMDGSGRYLDNIFFERLWRSLKQEAIYLKETNDSILARGVIKDWMTFQNTKRPHSAFDRQTPDDAYWTGLEEQKAA